jgi:hypothetical protein
MTKTEMNTYRKARQSSLPWLGIFVVLLPVLVARSQEFQAGVVNPRVATSEDSSQTFALYLPKNYSTETFVTPTFQVPRTYAHLQNNPWTCKLRMWDGL